MRSGLYVHEVAKQSGVDPWTVRYYEKVHLIPPAQRSAARYRVYPKESIDLIRFIKIVQGLGLTLAEIKKVIQARELKGKPCDHVVTLLKTKVDDLHQKINVKSSNRQVKRKEGRTDATITNHRRRS